MNPTEPALSVFYARKFLKELEVIANWNERTYGPKRAKRYIEFLNKAISELGIHHGKGTCVESHPEFQYVLVRRGSRGHGHIVVYQVAETSVTVLQIFHSAEDWERKLK